MEIKIRHTERGFAIAEFRDEYGEQCSIQKSSLATDDCIWLGVDAPSVKVGPPWKDVDLDTMLGEFGDVNIHSRMHLTREHVAALLPLLKAFVETGELESEEVSHADEMPVVR